MKRKKLSAVDDNPMEILKIAQDELKLTSKPMVVRQVAEKAHLALSSAVEVAIRKPIHSTAEETLGVKTIARWLKDPGVETEFKSLRRILHSDCFHQNKCPTNDKLLMVLGRTESLLERMLRSRKRKAKMKLKKSRAKTLPEPRALALLPLVLPPRGRQRLRLNGSHHDAAWPRWPNDSCMVGRSFTMT